ncbi:MAG: hypothetical protein H6746_20025 [Deltaproteobacteria bacterium]|nr:hypothetical protein [Deltaproteobacteria bacterium]
MQSPEDALRAAEPRPHVGGSRSDKKNYAERLSRHLSTVFANALRPHFDGVLPHADGTSQESRARTAKGFKKLDVNYSTPELGLGLGVSIKTLNFVDGSSARYTKNFSRIDNELRAEATDYHVRQPYSVLVAVLFLPRDSAREVEPRRSGGPSSFGAAVKYFRPRSIRRFPTDDPELFEGFFIGLYDPLALEAAPTRFFDVREPPPRARPPRSDESYSFAETVARIVATYDERNQPPFEWAAD